MTLRVSLAGRVSIGSEAVLIDEERLPGRQGRIVFAYLVIEQGRSVPRDELAEALWGQTPPATWEKALGVIASKLRALLGECGVDGAKVLTAAFGCYRLELPDGSWVDFVAAARGVDEAEAALAADEPERAKAAARLAASLARPPLLPGENGAWVEGKRRQLADVLERALCCLADACLSSGDPAEAAKWAQEAIVLEPFRESGYRRLMRAHAAAGNGAEALQAYERCRRLLDEELGAYPSPETESIYRELLKTAPADLRAAPSGMPLVSPATAIPGVEVPLAECEPQVGITDIDRPERISQPGAKGLSADSPPLRGAERVRAPTLRRRSLLAAVLAGVLAAAVAVPIFAFSRGGSGGSSANTSIAANAVGVVDLSNTRIAGSVPLGAAPKAIAYGQGSVWVAMPDQGSVVRIDPKMKAVQQTIGVGRGPSGIAVGDGFVWVANSLDGTVSQIDPRTNGGEIVNTIPVGNDPTGVAYGLGGVWVANSVDRTVVRIDPLTGRSGGPIPVEAGADAIAVGNGAVWVTSESAGVLSRVDPASGAVTLINIGNGPAAVAAGPGAVWVANSEDATVWRIDAATNRVTATITVGEGPSGVAVAPAGRSVWVASELAGTLSTIDPAVDRVVKTVTVDDLPQGVAVSADTAYVAVRGSSDAHRGGTLTVAIPYAAGSALPRSLDPASGYAAWELLTLTNDGLVGYGRSGGADSYRVVPDLASALPTVSNGGRTYTFRMRHGIHYSTGAVVRPADFRHGIERALLIGGADPPNSYLGGIVGAAGCVTAPKRCDLSNGIVTDPNSDTITFHLTAPDPDFLYKLALPMADAVPPSTPLKVRLPLPATGAYEIAQYDSKRGVIRLVRNPRFQLWSAAAQPDGYPDQIVERYGYTGASAVRAVQRGTADITAEGFSLTWPPAIALSLRTRYSSRLYKAPVPTTVGVWLNTRQPPFDDVRVRRAVNYAVDRNHLIELAGGSDVAQVGCQMLPPNTDGYRRYCPYTLHPTAAGSYDGPDLAKAQRLVAASGPKGQSITVWFYDIPTGRRNGAYVVSVLRSLGYKAQLETVPHDGRSTWRLHRQAGVGGGGADYPSANNFISPLFTCRSYDPARPDQNANTPGFCNRRIDAEIARARALQPSDPAAASQLWSKIDHEITDEAPWVVIRTSLAPDFVSRRTGNYTYCYLSALTGSTGACLDQLWVR